MFSETDLRELLALEAAGPVLSVYLNTDPAEGNAETHRLRLRTILKGIDSPGDVAAVEDFFNHKYNWAGRSVAVFSCENQKFFRAHPLAVPVNTRAYLSNRAIVKPLADLMENYGGYGVVLVDRQGARLFSFHMGELREQEGTLGESVKHTKRGGASTMPGNRGGTAGQTGYEEEVVQRNMKEAARFSVRFFEENHVRRVLIGGTDDNVSLFRTFLPKAWQSLVMGTFAMSMGVSHVDVLNRAMHVGSEAERQREARLVDALLTTAAKAGNAVIGLNDTLHAISADRVKTLLLMEDFHTAGKFCPACNQVTAGAHETCPACGGKMQPLDDVIEYAVSQVLRRGGEVEVVHDNPMLQKSGQIGAILRF